MFLRKAWEDKIISDSYMIYNAVFTAFYNVSRKKNKKALKLWKKNKGRKANEEVVAQNMKIIREVEQKEGKEWIEIILKANGLKRKGGEYG